jgi:hypothetical protein
MVEDSKEVHVMRSCKSNKDIQYNGKIKQGRRTNNDLQDITHKTKDRVTQTLLNTGGEFRCI